MNPYIGDILSQPAALAEFPIRAERGAREVARAHSNRAPAALLTFVNDLPSPTGGRTDVCILIHAGKETTVSTKTYINMLAINLLASIQLTGRSVDAAIQEVRTAANAMETYLSEWMTRVQELDSTHGNFDSLFLI